MIIITIIIIINMKGMRMMKGSPEDVARKAEVGCRLGLPYLGRHVGKMACNKNLNSMLGCIATSKKGRV